MRRLERGGGAQQPQENEMEAKLRQWKSGKDQGVPRAAQSMMQIPQSPIYADDDEPMQPPPKGSLPKESASYSYGTGADDHADAGTSLVDPAQADGAPPNRQAARGLVGALGAAWRQIVPSVASPFGRPCLCSSRPFFRVTVAVVGVVVVVVVVAVAVVVVVSCHVISRHAISHHLV